jgi:hypothetical protein
MKTSVWIGGIAPSIRNFGLNAVSGQFHAPTDLPSEQEAKNYFLRVHFILIYYKSQHVSNNPTPSWQFCTLVFVYAIGENHKPIFSPANEHASYLGENLCQQQQ